MMKSELSNNMALMHKTFSRNLTYHIENPHPSKKAVLHFASGAYTNTDISELIVALRNVQRFYAEKYGLNTDN